MWRIIIKTIKILLFSLLTLLGFSVIYFVTAVICSAIPINSDASCKTNCVEIFIISNGVHADIVVPIRTKEMDWSKVIKFAHTTSQDTSYKYLAFGWGDKNFYVNTPTWSDFELSSALYALFLFGEAAIHTTYFEDMAESQFSKKIHISKENYTQLNNFILSELVFDAQGNPSVINDFNYTSYDAFYTAKGTFTLFYTCNTWVNKALKQADQKACLWTPFVDGIFYQYGK